MDRPDPANNPVQTRPTARRTLPSGWMDHHALDLRLTQRDPETTRLVLLRVAWLTPEDRALVQAVLRDDHSIAALARMSRQDPRTLRRRFAAAVARVLDERTAFVARTLPTLTGARARVARAFYIEGRTLRDIATEHNLGLHTVRAHRQAIEGLFEASLNPSPTPDRAWRHPLAPATTPTRDTPDR